MKHRQFSFSNKTVLIVKTRVLFDDEHDSENNPSVKPTLDCIGHVCAWKIYFIYVHLYLVKKQRKEIVDDNLACVCLKWLIYHSIY
jgi:hypothetical protein